jgi:hypothetical protein
VAPTDTRKSINGLYALAKHELGKNSMDGSLSLRSKNRSNFEDLKDLREAKAVSLPEKNVKLSDIRDELWAD